MSTPHIQAQPGEFAPRVLMPGDPLRARHIANTYLTDVKQVNSVRNMLAFTGYYQEHRVSVMGSGMGIPSIALYAHELYSHFGVESIIRIGSCGALQPHVQLRDLILAQSASTDSSICRTFMPEQHYSPTATFSLLKQAEQQASQHPVNCHVGNLFSSDLFYHPAPQQNKRLRDSGVLAVEMEAAGLYTIAAHLGKDALAICTVSDHLLTGEALSSEERELNLSTMVQVALSV